ncbi:pyridoxal-phosphate dependent enzyme [Halocatena halophila]|uniref:pyridoxal-phosphate dependent enzyme n=1 Tax=Halocatena halophila TaxID=2814576 RepID=UPI002ED5E16B
MQTTAAFTGFRDPFSGEEFAPTVERHPDGGILDPAYALDSIGLSRDQASASDAFDVLMPIPASERVQLAGGPTPLVDCPRLADELGVESVYIKDEGANPTGSITDRGIALAISAARQHGATDVGLASTGAGGQSAAAFGARAGLTTHAYVPSRTPFQHKAMINVHGGDMNVVGGRFDDAKATFETESAELYPLGAFETPFRHEGAKQVAFECFQQLNWTVPDVVCYPFVGSAPLYGMAKGAREFAELGLVDTVPSFYAGQSKDCAPLVEAFESGATAVEPWDVPDTVAGALERPAPAGSELVLETLREHNGGAVAVNDDDILESAVTIASHEGIDISVAGGAAAAMAWELREEFSADDTLVLVNPASGAPDADLLRSHLMGQGI